MKWIAAAAAAAIVIAAGAACSLLTWAHGTAAVAAGKVCISYKLGGLWGILSAEIMFARVAYQVSRRLETCLLGRPVTCQVNQRVDWLQGVGFVLIIGGWGQGAGTLLSACSAADIGLAVVFNMSIHW